MWKLESIFRIDELKNVYALSESKLEKVGNPADGMRSNLLAKHALYKI